jgi:hypothetical protein
VSGRPIDNTVLAILLHPKAKPPNDPKTGLPLTKSQERIEQLITDLDAEDERIIIPTPAPLTAITPEILRPSRHLMTGLRLCLDSKLNPPPI